MALLREVRRIKTKQKSNYSGSTTKSRDNGFQGTNKFFSVIGGFLLLPTKEIKKNVSKGPQFSIHYWRISVTLGASIAGVNCTSENIVFFQIMLGLL